MKKTAFALAFALCLVVPAFAQNVPSPVPAGEEQLAATLRDTRAAERGDAIAQTNLGEMYRQGQGVEKDDAEAIEQHPMAADQGANSGRRNLGVMSKDEPGAARDEVKGIAWYRKAADQGNADAQNSLREMDRQGRLLSGSAKPTVEEPAR